MIKCIFGSENNIYKENEELFKDFEKNLLCKNRYTLNHEFISRFKKEFEINNPFVPNIALKNKSIIYRARIYEDDETEEEIKNKPPKFIGYNKIKSFTPPRDKCKSGRINPEGIVYLYASKNLETAIKEVRPYLRQTVSVAKIQVNKTLKLLNLASKYNARNANCCLNAIKDLLSEILAIPVRPEENKKYFVTQYIAEVVKNMGYDGIAYRSAFDIEDINYCIFNYNECEAISSNKYVPIRIAMRYQVYNKLSIFEDILSSMTNFFITLF